MNAERHGLATQQERVKVQVIRVECVRIKEAQCDISE